MSTSSVASHQLSVGKNPYTSLQLENSDFHKDTHEDRGLERRAAMLLEKQPHFRGRSQLVTFRSENKRLRLYGCLPSYYLKQIAQEAVRELDFSKLENLIHVSS